MLAEMNRKRVEWGKLKKKNNKSSSKDFPDGSEVKILPSKAGVGVPHLAREPREFDHMPPGQARTHKTGTIM